MTFAEAFNPGLDASVQLTTRFGQSKLLAFGERFENKTLKNTDNIKGVNNRYDPFLNPLKETMQTRRSIINDPRTSPGERAAQQKDLKVEAKRYDGIMNRKKRDLDPYVGSNNAYNGSIITLGVESQLFHASPLRDEAFHWDRSRQDPGEGAGAQSGTTTFAPGMGFFSGAGSQAGGAAGAQGGGGGK